MKFKISIGTIYPLEAEKMVIQSICIIMPICMMWETVLKQEYKKAIPYYEYLEPLSLNYTKKKVKSYCLSSLKKYHDPKIYEIKHTIRKLDYFKKNVSKEIYSYLIAGDPISQIFTEIPKVYDNKDSLIEPKEVLKEIEQIKLLIEKVDMKEKQSLHELLSLIYLEKYKNTIEMYSVFGQEFEKERKYFEEAHNEYINMEKTFATSIYYKFHAHKYLVQIYNKVGKDYGVEVDSFEENSLLLLKKMYDINQDITKRHGKSFCLHSIFPFATEKDIYAYYKDTVRSYKDFTENISSKFIVDRLEYSHIPYKVKERYAKQFPLVNLMDKIVNLERNRGIDAFLKIYEERYSKVVRAINDIELEEKNIVYELLQIVHMHFSMNKIIEGFENNEYKKSIEKLRILEKKYQEAKENLDPSPSFDAVCHKIMMKLETVQRNYLDIVLIREHDFSINTFLNKVQKENESLVKKHGNKFYFAKPKTWRRRYSR